LKKNANASKYKRLADRVEGGFSDVEKAAVLEKIRPDDVSQPLPKLDPSLKPLDVVSHLRSSGHIQPQLADVVVAGIIYSRSIAERRSSSAGNSSVEVNPCVVAAKAQARRPSLYERDFTTSNGVTGSLHCPYAKPTGNANRNGKSTTTTTYQDGQSSTKCGFDPIKADISQDRVSSAGASARSSTAAAARCPIRYMDDHSPEELAKYFENHKHEIPRSHAICVNRFQRNQTTMRQIDAKYGSLVSMIQGLGAKHKSLLPEAEQNVNGTSPSERVEKWAEDVSSKSPHPATLSTVEEDASDDANALDDEAHESDDRVSHFERPLREIRVGESPSRPWGIPIPVAHQLSAVNSPVAKVNAHAPSDIPEMKTPKPTDSDIQQLQDVSPTPARPKGKCPFDHTAFMKKPAATAPTTVAEDFTQDKPVRDDNAHAKPAQAPASAPVPNTNPNTNPSQMVFNGPVFFGYSAEETAALMQQLSNSKV
jgi:hypothetical protein